jgi:hypothetical protein
MNLSNELLSIEKLKDIIVHLAAEDGHERSERTPVSLCVNPRSLADQCPASVSDTDENVTLANDCAVRHFARDINVVVVGKSPVPNV